MPGVRYGPDITDDAAQMLTDIITFKEQKKRGKVDKDVRRRYNRAVKMAKQLFGLSDKDIETGRYKDLKVMAEYGDGARRVGGKRGFYRRGKLARNKRTGKFMKRSAMEEGRIQTLSDAKPMGRTVFPKGEVARMRRDDESPRVSYRDKAGRLRTRKKTQKEIAEAKELSKLAIDAGGLTYLGRTNPKRLRDAQARLDRRMARSKGVLSDRGTRRVKIRPYLKGGKSDIAKLNIAKQRKEGKPVKNIGIRGRKVALPKKSAAATRAKSANKARKAAVKRGGRKTNVRRGRKK